MKNIFIYIGEILFFTFLIIGSILFLEGKKDISEIKSSFQKTKFDYIIEGPSNEQVDEISKKEFISNIKPFYLFDSLFESNGIEPQKINLILTEKFYDDFGFFNEKTLIKGNNFLKDNEIKIDNRFAEKMNLKINDIVFTYFKNKKISFKVSGIYMASYYPKFNEGISLALISKEISEIFNNKLTYNYAFVESNNKEKSVEYFNNYVPLGNLKKETQYINEYKAKNSKPDHLSDDEWDGQIKLLYQKYKNTYLDMDFKNSTEIKDNFKNFATSKSLIVENKIKIYLGTLFSASFLILFGFFFLTLFKNKSDDFVDHKDGKRFIILKYLLVFNIISILIFIITFITLFVLFKPYLFDQNILYYIIAFSSFNLLISLFIMSPIVLFIYNFIIKYDGIRKSKKA